MEFSLEEITDGREIRGGVLFRGNNRRERERDRGKERKTGGREIGKGAPGGGSRKEPEGWRAEEGEAVQAEWAVGGDVE